MKIVIGVDHSAHARAAVDFVRRLEWPAASTALVVTAVRPLVAAYAEVHVPVAQTERVTEEQVRAAEVVVTDSERVLREAGLKTEGRVLRGDAREALVETAKSERADLLVVGSHGRTGLAKLLMGSVAAHVVTHAPCSVLVVKGEPEA